MRPTGTWWPRRLIESFLCSDRRPKLYHPPQILVRRRLEKAFFVAVEIDPSKTFAVLVNKNSIPVWRSIIFHLSMTTNEKLEGESLSLTPNASPVTASKAAIAAGILCWAAISLGFFGLKILMEKRPEFVGQPVVGAKAEMVQESPRIVTRKVSDDVSVVKPMQPELSEVRFDMAGRRDYRGLRTVMDMSGEFHGRFVLTNTLEEPIFVLFKCPHPRTDRDTGGNLLASGLRLQASVNGAQENSGDAWLWSGTLEAHGGSTIDISYQAAALKSVTYRVGEQNGNPVNQLRLTFHRQDLDSMSFGSGDGAQPSRDA
ncbi:MAG: hypothetical protein JWR69_4317, partial [Pedosphaera sp.]|nr:hypothetical protein [Pedosphaera sp.]